MYKCHDKCSKDQILLYRSYRPYRSYIVVSKPFLSLQQILHQRLVETDARIHGNVVDVGFGTFDPVEVAKFLDRLQVIAAHAAGVDHQLLMILNVFKFNRAVKRKMDFGLIQNVEKDDFVAAMAQVVHPLQYRAGVGEQIAEQYDQALAADHGGQLVQAMVDV